MAGIQSLAQAFPCASDAAIKKEEEEEERKRKKFSFVTHQVSDQPYHSFKKCFHCQVSSIDEHWVRSQAAQAAVLVLPLTGGVALGKDAYLLLPQSLSFFIYKMGIRPLAWSTSHHDREDQTG